MCSPFLDGVKIKDRFDKQLIAYIPQINDKTYITLLGATNNKLCSITTKSNNLNDCDLMDTSTKIVIAMLNDLTNIRHGASR
jgi:hypothetical protein